MHFSSTPVILRDFRPSSVYTGVSNVNASGLKQVKLTAVWNLVGYVKNFDYTGGEQTWAAPYTGYYKLEVWGAQGGNCNYQVVASGGKGGYSVGTIKLSKNQTGYIYVGQQGVDRVVYSTSRTISGGFNGGGGTTTYGGSGGGATDIRFVEDSYYARVIVAGGGGGGGIGKPSIQTIGGVGGGVNGSNGTDGSDRGGYGASQISGDAFGYALDYETYGRNPGSGNGGGGGGGWYGGEHGCSAGDESGGGGGSGWIYTASTYSYWAANSTEGKSGKWKLDSSYYLTSASTVVGNTTFKSPSGSNETGHSGNGYARITWLGDTI